MKPSGTPLERLAGIADSPAAAGEFFTLSLTSNGDTLNHCVAGEDLRWGELVTARLVRPWWAFWREPVTRYFRLR